MLGTNSLIVFAVSLLHSLQGKRYEKGWKMRSIPNWIRRRLLRLQGFIIIEQVRSACLLRPTSTITRPSASSIARKFSKRCQSETTRGTWVAQTMHRSPRGGLHPKGRESLSVPYVFSGIPGRQFYHFVVQLFRLFTNTVRFERYRSIIGVLFEIQLFSSFRPAPWLPGSTNIMHHKLATIQ